MNYLTKAGRLFYGMGIFAYGAQQLLIKDFRPEILPPFPAWAHQYIVFPFITGLALIVAGIAISGVIRIDKSYRRMVCLYTGFYFLLLIVNCHLPYTLFISPNKLSHLGVWAQALKELAFCGGAFVTAGSFTQNSFAAPAKSHFILFLEKMIPLGRIFFATTMILYGCSHFVYLDFIAPMVPKWFGVPVFWACFAGVALIGSGIAIVFRIWIQPVALLLALMLFIWLLVIHIPGAVANPYVGNGNLVVSAFDALLFCGVALQIGNQHAQRYNEAAATKRQFSHLYS